MPLFKNVDGVRSEMTTQEEAEFEASRMPNPMQADQINHEKDTRLAATDWTQVSDVGLTAPEKYAWNTYRTRLRGVSDAPTLEADIPWPEPPSDTRRNGR